MAIYHNLNDYHTNEHGVCAALGFFDGVHIGHRAVVGGCAADESGLPCAVLTFAESPALSLGRPAPPLLTDNARKAALLTQAGAKDIIFADFAALRDQSPARFVRNVLCDRLNARKVYCGFNYRFGRNGAGDTEMLKALCKEQGIEVIVKEPVYLDKEPVSSSRIRTLLAAGDISRANAMLGYPYAITGSVEGGNHIGATMGFPTVNLPLSDGIAVPRFGVYASALTIDGRTYIGATNIGVHPTVGANDSPLCETFLLDFGGGDLYGKNAVCALKAFIRPEKRFASPEELAAQVKQDCRTILQATGI